METKPQRQNPDALSWDEEKITVKASAADRAAKATFSFTNRTAKPVTVTSVHPSCGCTTVRLPQLPWTIPPGSQGKFDATIDLRGKHGILNKAIVVFTDQGQQLLKMSVEIAEPLAAASAGGIVPMDRAKNLQEARADRQAVLQGSCAVCHVEAGEGKLGLALYAADCAICHDSPERASMVPVIDQGTWKGRYTDLLRIVTNGKPGTLMPAFSRKASGVLSDSQIASLVGYIGSGAVANRARATGTVGLH